MFLITATRWSILSVFLSLLFAGPSTASSSQSLVLSGQHIEGNLATAGETASFRIEGVQGAKLTVSVSGQLGLRPVIGLQDAAAGELITLAGNGKKAAAIKNFKLPKTGSYCVLITGHESTPTGSFVGTVKVKVPAAKKSLKIPGAIHDAGVAFDAVTLARLSGKVKRLDGVAQGDWITLVGPSGPVDLSAALEAAGGGQTLFIKPLFLTEAGTYTLSATDPNIAFTGKLDLDFPEDKGGTAFIPLGSITALDPVLIEPTPPLTASNSITVRGLVDGAKRVGVTGPAGTMTVDVIGSVFEVEVPLATNSKNYLSFYALDEDGNAGPAVPRVVVQDIEAPTLAITYPVDGAEVVGDDVVVTGHVGDMLAGASGLIVKVNGTNAEVSLGKGTDGTFELAGSKLSNGNNVIKVVAKDSLGNKAKQEITVKRVSEPKKTATLEKIGGAGQSGLVGTEVAQPITVRVRRDDGTPWANKLVTFQVTRSDGLLAGESMTPGSPLVGLFSDANGIAAAYWTLGDDAGIGNNQVTVTSVGAFSPVVFCATADPELPDRIHVSQGNHQRAAVDSLLPVPLSVRVTDGQNPVADVVVVFTVEGGGGTVLGQSSATVASDVTGLASVQFRVGHHGGSQLVSATFAGNQAAPARFFATAVAPAPAQPTVYRVLVTDNADRPLGGASCELMVAGATYGPVSTGVDGRAEISGILAGPAELSVDGKTANQLAGAAIPLGSFPGLHFPNLVVVKNAVNQPPGAVRLPRLETASSLTYDGGELTVTLAGIEGLSMKIAAGSMTLADGTKPDALTPVKVSLSQVPFDEIPMPLPDGVATPFAWTMQPAGASFDPPIRVETPNMTGVSPGSKVNLLTFNHATSNFESVGLMRASSDGAKLVSEPGSGLTLAGWGSWSPPPPPTTDVKDCTPVVNGCGPAWLGPIGPVLLNCFLVLGSLSLPTIVCFTTQCNDHDKCYGTCNNPKSACDQAFLGDMLLHCENTFPSDPIAAARCFQKAVLYYLAVSAFGGGAYSDAQLAACACPGSAFVPDSSTFSGGPPDSLEGDDDGDLMLDEWELANGLDPADPSDAFLDGDADQVINFGEFFHDLDPNNTDTLGNGFGDLQEIMMMQPPPTLALDSTWTVTLAGQSAPVSPVGTYRIANVPVGDELVRITATGLIGGQGYYGYSDFFGVTEGDAQAAGSLLLVASPLPTPTSLSVTPAGTLVLTPGQVLPLVVTGQMSDNTLANLSSRASGSSFQSSNAAIALVDINGQVTAGTEGVAYITVTNQGVTASRKVQVAATISATTVVGFVQKKNGKALASATVSAFGSSSLTGSDGSFMLPLTLPGSQTSALVTAGGDGLFASTTVQVVKGGFTDAGVLVVEKATTILVYGDRINNGGSVDSVVNVISSLGLPVESASDLPVDLSPFGVIWHFDSSSAMTVDEQLRLRDFVVAGGGLHMTGERPCCEANNDSIEALINQLGVTPPVQIGGLGDIGGTYSFNPNATGDISETPNTLGVWNANGLGGISSAGTISGENVLATSSLGVVVGLVYDCRHMQVGKGRVTILMDGNWTSNTGIEDDIENIITYLRGKPDCN